MRPTYAGWARGATRPAFVSRAAPELPLPPEPNRRDRRLRISGRIGNRPKYRSGIHGVRRQLAAHEAGWQAREVEIAAPPRETRFRVRATVRSTVAPPR